jgi:N-carbamoylputrescine amidase
VLPNQSQAPRSVVLGLVQMRCAEDPQTNLDRALDRISAAARQGAQVVCLPELFHTRYFCQREDAAQFALAEPVPGATTAALAERARELGVVVAATVFERRAPGLYHNTAVVLDAGGDLAGVYRKMHIPDDPHFHEKFYFSPGDTGFVSFPTRAGVRVGTLVCWDQWFPEAARLTTLSGAEVLLYPTTIGWLETEKAADGRAQHEAWETVQRGHAIANGVFVAAVNRTGREGGIEFWGASFVADPFGRILARASHDREETLVVSCDLGLLDVVRCEWPFLRDRRVDAYAGIQNRYLDPERPAK